MNQKELNEIRRRFKLDKNAFSKIYGCYVNSNKEIISYVDASMGLMSQEEQEMYLNLLKKTLSGTLGRNLIDIVFSTAQVADSEGDDVVLEYTQADVVRGRRVRIGEGCSIGRVEYSESLDAWDGTVGESVCTGQDAQ